MAYIPSILKNKRPSSGLQSHYLASVEVIIRSRQFYSAYRKENHQDEYLILSKAVRE
jgi:hypothetical protein